MGTYLSKMTKSKTLCLCLLWKMLQKTHSEISFPATDSWAKKYAKIIYAITTLFSFYIFVFFLSCFSPGKALLAGKGISRQVLAIFDHFQHWRCLLLLLYRETKNIQTISHLKAKTFATLSRKQYFLMEKQQSSRLFVVSVQHLNAPVQILVPV